MSGGGIDLGTQASLVSAIGDLADAAATGDPDNVTSAIAYLKEIVLGIGVDGANDYVGQFDESTLAGLVFVQHQDAHILFVIPEALGSINVHNVAIRTELEKLAHVDTIFQNDALTYPDFTHYSMIVTGTDNGTAWTVSNLDHIKEFEGTVLCCDATAAAQLLIGSDGLDAAAKTVLVAITQIEANDLGIGHAPDTGLVSGNNTVSASATYNTLDMSDADITETFYGTEAVADNTDVLLAAIYKRQPDGSRGVLSDGTEAKGTRWFYGCAFSADDLNTLGNAVLGLIVHMVLQAAGASAAIEISGDIGDLETKIFGNQANEFNNGNPMVEYLTGRNSSGTRLPIGKSIYDLLGAYLDAGGGLGTDNLAADLALIHNLVDSAETAGPFSYLDAGGEQDVVEETATTRRRVSVEIDLNTMTQDGTIRIFRKVDGTTYRLYTETAVTAAQSVKVHDAQFVTNQDWKLTYQESADEGAARSIPFNTVIEVIE